MSAHLEINDGNFIHISSVKRLRLITEKDRDSLSSLGQHVDADKYSTRIDYRDGTRSYAQETIDEIADQGIALVDIGDGTFVPRDNIIRTRNISAEDRQSFENRLGRPMAAKFRSQLESKAGKILSAKSAKEIMQGISYPYQAQTERPDENSISDQRTRAMSAAAPSNGRENSNVKSREQNAR